MYGSVFDTVGKDSVNFMVTTSLVVTTSDYSGEGWVVVRTCVVACLMS